MDFKHKPRTDFRGIDEHSKKQAAEEMGDWGLAQPHMFVQDLTPEALLERVPSRWASRLSCRTQVRASALAMRSVMASVRLRMLVV